MHRCVGVWNWGTHIQGRTQMEGTHTCSSGCQAVSIGKESTFRRSLGALFSGSSIPRKIFVNCLNLKMETFYSFEVLTRRYDIVSQKHLAQKEGVQEQVVQENTVRRRKLDEARGEWRESHYSELHGVQTYSSSNIFYCKVIESNEMGGACCTLWKEMQRGFCWKRVKTRNHFVDLDLNKR